MRTGWDKSEIRHGGGSASRRVLLCALIALACVCAFALAGCKYSDVLTQHTEDPTAEIDENAEPIYESNPDADLEMDLQNTSIDDADDEDTQVATLPHYDPNAPDNGPTKQRVKSAETPHDEVASEGEAEGEPDREGTGEGDNGGEEQNNSEGDEEGQDEGAGDNLEDDNASEQEQSQEGGGNGDTVVVDDDGTTEDTAKGTVAAVGEYATMAQMLGGAGALAGTSQSWLDGMKAVGAFAKDGDELSRVSVAFTGDGTAAGSCKVDDLISTIQPSVVLWDSVANEPNLTEAERSKLEAAGITVQPVPHIGEKDTEDYAVKQALAEVASVLAGASGLQYDPAGVLEQYNTFHDNALKNSYNANGGYSYKVTTDSYIYPYQDTPLSGLGDSTTTRVMTVYVDSVKTSPVSSTVINQSGGGRTLSNNGRTLDCSDGIAMSVESANGSGYQLIDYYLQLAGVMNNAYDVAKPSAGGKRYVLMPGSASVFDSAGNYAHRLDYGTAFFFNSGESSVASNWHALGDTDFSTVLVANDDIKTAFETSAAKSNGLYHMDGSYRIIVVPTGIAGQWTEGHIDSFLLALWSFRIQSEDNLDAAASYASNFYSTFLRCDDWSNAISNWDDKATAS